MSCVLAAAFVFSLVDNQQFPIRLGCESNLRTRKICKTVIKGSDMTPSSHRIGSDLGTSTTAPNVLMPFSTKIQAAIDSTFYANYHPKGLVQAIYICVFFRTMVIEARYGNVSCEPLVHG